MTLTHVATAAARPAADYDEVSVVMKDNNFIPQTITVDPGTVVEWKNEGRSAHNVVPDSPSPAFAASPTIQPKKSFEEKLDAPGTYTYYCSFHGAPGKGMYGTVIVRNADGSIPASVRNHTKAAKRGGPPKTIRVPKDQKTIQKAVDSATPGSLILISKGTYHEAVTVTTDNLVLRGLNRNDVVLDGGYKLDNGVKVIGADGVAVENMTARKYTKNGFFWTDVNGYRGSYLTATRNGDYGIYSFASVNGLFDHDYASGSPDAGFYIGQCFPCDAAITHVISEYNGLGFSGSNAGGNLLIMNSRWDHNRAGIVPNSDDSEKNPPQHGATVFGNVVYDNNNDRSPAIDAAREAQYNGIVVAGGNDNVVRNNLVYGHKLSNIIVVVRPGDPNWWTPNDNKVFANVARGAKYADLAALGGSGNCFSGNRFAKSHPAKIEQVYPCTGAAAIAAVDPVDPNLYLASRPPSVDYTKAKTPKPPRLRGMKNPAHAKARPANHIVVKMNTATIVTPKAPTGS